MTITSKTGKQLNFLETGVDGIYVLDHVAFKDKFDEDGNNFWDKSTGNKKLQEWAENNLPKEILEQFDVDIPTIEEVFSQKMLNMYESTRRLKSKQFPIFQNSDNRMMEFNGKPMWWWTRSAHIGNDYIVWVVYTVGGMRLNDAYHEFGFVPVLRKKEFPIYEIDGYFHTDGDFYIREDKFDTKFVPFIKKVKDEDYSLHFKTNDIREALWFLEQLFVSYDVSYTHCYVLESLIALTNQIYKHLENGDKGIFSSVLLGNYEGTRLTINIKE